MSGNNQASQQLHAGTQHTMGKITPEELIHKGMEFVKYGLRMSRHDVEAERIIAQIEILLNS